MSKILQHLPPIPLCTCGSIKYNNAFQVAPLVALFFFLNLLIVVVPQSSMNFSIKIHKWSSSMTHRILMKVSSVSICSCGPFCMLVRIIWQAMDGYVPTCRQLISISLNTCLKQLKLGQPFHLGLPQIITNKFA